MMEVKNKIGFSGKMTAGKTTISNLLAEKYGYVVLPIGGRIKKVSNLLIEDRDQLMAYLEQILPDKTLDNSKNPVQTTFDALVQMYDEHFMPIVSKYGLNNVFVKEENGVYQKNEYYRDLTQKVGTCVRNLFGEQIWVQILLNEANLLISQGKKVICDDVRLEIEYKMFKEQGYTLIRLDVDPEVQKKRILKLYKTYNEKALTHHTETELDNAEFEYRFSTSVDPVEETLKKVEKVITESNDRN